MNICLLCYRGDPYCGGQGIYLYYLTKALSEQGHKLTLLVGPPYPLPLPWANVVKLPNLHFWGKPLKDQLPEKKVATLLSPLNLFEYAVSRIGYCPEAMAFSFRAAAKFKELHEAEAFDIVHDVETLGFGLLFIRAMGVPVVSTIHHPLTQDLMALLPRAQSFMERYYNTIFYPLLMQGFVARHIDGLITSSKVGQSELRSAFRVNGKNTHLVYTGVDTEIFSPDYSVERLKNEILFVGNAEDRRKGVLYLLEALKLLPEEVKLTIVDKGEPHKYYAPGLVKEYGLKHRVSFTGRLTDEELVNRYRTASVLVMPSLFEGFGLPVAEAMSCSTPLVTTKAGSLPEVVGANQEGGLLTPPKNPQALAEAINKLLSDDLFSKELGRRARKRIESLFNWTKTAGNTVLVYRKLIERHKKYYSRAPMKGIAPCVTTKTN